VILVNLLLTAVVALASGICLLKKKRSAQTLSLTLGITLILLGITLSIYDRSWITIFKFLFGFVESIGRLSPHNPYPDLNSMFFYFGIFELVCFVYGIFVSIYFTRKNVSLYLRGVLNNKIS
jgi:hypothetical protein